MACRHFDRLKVVALLTGHRAIIGHGMHTLFAFCAALDELHVRYGMLVTRSGAVMVTVVIPGQYLEIEFFTDGTVEIERFVSQGVEGASEAELDELIEAFGS